MQDEICRIPVTATFTIIDGKPVMTAAEYADVSAEAIARFLVDKLGADTIGGADLEPEV